MFTGFFNPGEATSVRKILNSNYSTPVAYWPLTEPSIRDVWDSMFHLCKQEDSPRQLTSGSRSRESQPECIGVMKLYIHRYPQNHKVTASECPKEADSKWPPGGTRLRTSRQGSKDVRP